MEIVDEIRGLVKRALRKGEAEAEIEETLFEDVYIESDEDWETLLHEDIPAELRNLLKQAGLACNVYHKKDDVPGFEYVANCITKDGRPVALGFDIYYDYEFGKVTLLSAEAWANVRWSPSQLVYYHEV